MLQIVLISMIVMMRRILKGWYTKRKGLIRRISSLIKMILMKMNLQSSKGNQLIIFLVTKEVMMNQMKKMTMLEAKKYCSWHSQMMMIQD